MNELPFVSILIPTFNGKHHLKECLASLRKLDYPADRFEILVIDNASTDGTDAWMEKNHPAITLIKNRKNLGFALANNLAADAACGEWLALLNNDTRIDPQWLTAMVKHADMDNKVAAVSSRISTWNGKETEFGGGELHLCGFGFQYSSWKDTFKKLAPGTEVPFACGGSMLVHRETFLDVGGFDKDYFAFYEDVDLGWRLWLLGFRVLYTPDAIAYHKGHSTVTTFSEAWRYFHWTRNALLSVFKNYEDQNVKRVFTLAVLLTLERQMCFVRMAREAPEKALQERYQKIAFSMAEALEWTFNHVLEFKKKRKLIQDRRIMSDRALNDKFQLRLNFDDIPNAAPENILSARLMEFFDLSDLLETRQLRENLLNRLEDLHQAYLGEGSSLHELQAIKSSKTYRILGWVRKIGSFFSSSDS